MPLTMTEYYQNLKVGLCPRCGGERDAEGLLCNTCLVKCRQAKARLSKKLKYNHSVRYRARMKRAGLCPHCGQVPEPGRVHCKRKLESAWRYRQRKKRGLVDVN